MKENQKTNVYLLEKMMSVNCVYNTLEKIYAMINSYKDYANLKTAKEIIK